MTQTYRDPAVNNEQKPIASNGPFDLMAIERRMGAWIAEVRSDAGDHRYVSSDGIYWFNMASGRKVVSGGDLDALLCDRVSFIEAMEAAGEPVL